MVSFSHLNPIRLKILTLRCVLYSGVYKFTFAIPMKYMRVAGLSMHRLSNNCFVDMAYRERPAKPKCTVCLQT